VKVLVVSGIWPPDVGGPASHAPEVARFLGDRGHEVEVVVTADAQPAPEPFPVHWVSRAHRPGSRHVLGVRLIRERALRADVVYTTGTFGRSAAGATLAGTPFVVKLTADPAYERARRRSITEVSIADFQQGGGGLQIALLRFARDQELRRAAHVICPSAYLRELAIGWGLRPENVSVLPNPTPVVPELPPTAELRARLGVGSGPLLAFAGRLTAQKALRVALEAVAGNPGVTLLIAGEGPERPQLEAAVAELGVRDRVRLLGPLPRLGVLELFRAADASILSSSWENFPHTVVEALAVGTPVLTTAAGGVAEVVTDGLNGLVVAVGDTDGLTAAVRRYFADADLRERLRAAAVASVVDYSRERVFGRLEELLVAAALGTGTGPGTGAPTP
jgi:glycosyltransferase involved in cell wall biosynthesis